VFGEQQQQAAGEGLEPPVMPASVREQVLGAVAAVATRDSAAAVRSAACKVLGALCMHEGALLLGLGEGQQQQQQQQQQRAVDVLALRTIGASLAAAVHDSAASVRIAAAWALGSLCDALRQLQSQHPSSSGATAADADAGAATSSPSSPSSLLLEVVSELPGLAQAALHAAADTEKVGPGASGSSSWQPSTCTCLPCDLLACLATSAS
jgi:hypothetical protein